MEEDSSRTPLKLAEQLRVLRFAEGRRLKAMGKIFEGRKMGTN